MMMMTMMMICIRGTFDMLIIGGGSTGVGTALDAATRGLKYVS
jgi:glycerol-3-phosphate dehydrogenase